MWRFSSIKRCLSLAIMFNQKLSFDKGLHPRLSSIKGCLSSKVASIESCLPMQVINHRSLSYQHNSFYWKKNGCSQSKLQSHATTTELTGTDKQAGAQDHLLCQADALTKNVDLPLFDKSNFDVTTFLI